MSSGGKQGTGVNEGLGSSAMPHLLRSSGTEAATDATVARAYAFLAAALAGDSAPPRQALAAELATVLDVQAFAVLQAVDDHLLPVMDFGFPVDVLDAVGTDAVGQALAQGLPIVEPGEQGAPLRSLAVVPATMGGRPWGVIVLGSAIPDAFGEQLISRAVGLASGIAVVLMPLTTSASRLALSRERRLRHGLEALVDHVVGMLEAPSPRHAAQALADSLVRNLSWERVLLLVDRPDLGVLPAAVAGVGIRAQDVIGQTGRRDLAQLAGAREPTMGGEPLFAGSQSQIAVPVSMPGYATRGVLVIEATEADGFDDVDLEVATGLAHLAGPVLGRLWQQAGARQQATPDVASGEAQRRRFVSLAHELRTPVTVMIGYADLLATPGPNSEQRQTYGATVARHARALGRMVDNALVTWQLDDGTLELANGPISMRDAVKDAIEQLGMETAADRVEPIVGLADAFWFPRVIAALLDNARRYVPDAEVQITTQERGDVIRLAVHDDGPGITSDELAHIFDAFHRGEDGGTSPHRGVGLGLTVARELMRAMGGELDVVSAPDYGTTFTITVPLAR